MLRKIEFTYVNTEEWWDDTDIDVRDMPRALTQLANTAVVYRKYLRGVHRLCDRLLTMLEASPSRRSKQLTTLIRCHVGYLLQNTQHLTQENEDLLVMTQNQVQMVSTAEPSLVPI
jgi:hypothetical protein